MFVFTSAEQAAAHARSGGTPRSFVVTIGNFDGVHTGHQALIRRAVARAHEQGCLALVVTFEPHPAKVLSGQKFLALGSIDQRLDIFQILGVDGALVLPFNAEFAARSAEDFCRSVLADTLHIHELFVGYDFRMGTDQAGAEQLAGFGQTYGFGVTSLPAVQFNGAPISSSRIRRSLEGGELELANIMLGRPYAVRGLVVHGEGRGGPVLGMPTANMDVAGVMLPQPAIYGTTAWLVDSAALFEPVPAPPLAPGLKTGRYALPAVTSFGKNPTFGGEKLTLETHILDFEADIYGRILEVAFVQQLRSEKKFSGAQELIAQIQADIATRRALGMMF